MIFHSLSMINRNITKYAEAVQQYNYLRLNQTLLIAMFFLFCAMAMGLFSTSMRMSIPGYMSAFAVFFLIQKIFSRESMRKYVLAGWYLLSVSGFGLALYLSLFRFPGRPAATMLTVLCIIPLLFIDRPCRFIPAFLGLYLLNTYFSFVVKGAEFGYIDMINGFVSGGLGFMIGTSLIIMRLKSFEVEDQLIREKTTDVLTGVWNRRKLFEAIDRIKEGKETRPSGVFMVDVDHFKDFNDTYGHAAGDECLHEMGKLFLNLQQQDRVIFYRYGGEEFIVFLYDCSDKDIRETAENIRKSAAEMQVCGRRVTVSIGTVYCDDLSVADYEVWISRADKAAYAAKKNSRNIVVSWNERQQMRH